MDCVSEMFRVVITGKQEVQKGLSYCCLGFLLGESWIARQSRISKAAQESQEIENTFTTSQGLGGLSSWTEKLCIGIAGSLCSGFHSRVQLQETGRAHRHVWAEHFSKLAEGWHGKHRICSTDLCWGSCMHRSVLGKLRGFLEQLTAIQRAIVGAGGGLLYM